MSYSQRGTREGLTREKTLKKIEVQLTNFNDDLFKPIEVLIKEKRDRIADEILRSEQTYVKSLNLLYSHFKFPLIEMAQMGQLAITDSKIQVLFGNLEDIINVNTVLLQSMIERMQKWSCNQKIGDVLLTLAPFLKLYTYYSFQYGKASDVLREITKDKKVKQYLIDRASDPICAGLDFGSYLIMPIQRIPRYRLLLEEFIKETPKEHEDYNSLVEALSKLKGVAKEVDNAIIEEENRVNMLKACKKFLDYKEKNLLQPGRKFIYEGELTKVCRKERKRRHFFLFSDCLIYSHPPVPPQPKFKIEVNFPLANVRAQDIDSKVMENAFQLQSDMKSFVVIADTPREKKEWLDVIASALNQLKEKNASFKASARVALSKPTEDVPKAPVWEEDSLKKDCTLCKTKFTFTNRRHHCRQCGTLVCQECSNQKRMVPGQGRVRVCKTCATKGSASVIVEESAESESNQPEVSGESEPGLYELQALHDFEPEVSNSNKLQFKKGDMLSIIKVDDSGWWYAELNGRRGWVPDSFLQKQ